MQVFKEYMGNLFIECSSGSVDTSPYGFFGEDCVEDGGGRPPPIHVYSTPTTPATTAHFQHIPSEGSECPDDNYGTIDTLCFAYAVHRLPLCDI